MATGVDTDLGLLATTDLAEYVGSTNSTGDYYKLNDVINYVSMRFETETSRNLKSRSYTEVYDGNGKSELYLNNFPLSSTTITITIDGNRAFDDTGDQVTSTDVMLTTGPGLVRLDNDTFSAGTGNVQITYSAGYSTATEHGLTYAAKELGSLMWQRMRQKEAIGVRSESFEGHSVTYENDLPWSVKKVLDTYRDRRFA